MVRSNNIGSDSCLGHFSHWIICYLFVYIWFPTLLGQPLKSYIGYLGNRSLWVERLNSSILSGVSCPTGKKTGEKIWRSSLWMKFLNPSRCKSLGGFRKEHHNFLFVNLLLNLSVWFKNLMTAAIKTPVVSHDLELQNFGLVSVCRLPCPWCFQSFCTWISKHSKHLYSSVFLWLLFARKKR